MKTPLLDRLIVVIKQACDLNLRLYMESFYADGNTKMSLEVELHSCNTAACVAGYGILDEVLRTKVGSGNPADLWDELEMEIGYCLTNSIFKPHENSRKRVLKYIGNSESLTCLQHVNNDTPTIHDAYEYLLAAKKHLDKHGTE